MKKILLGLGAVATAVAPIVVAVSCADEKPKYSNAINNVPTRYKIGYDSASLKTLLDEFAQGNKAAKYSEIMEAISIGTTDGSVLMDEVTFSLVGNVLTKTQLFKMQGKTYTIETIFTISPAT